MLRMTAVEAWAEGFEAREAAAGGELPGLFASAIRGAQNAADQPPVELNTALSARRMHFEMRRGFLEHAHTELLALATALKLEAAANNTKLAHQDEQRRAHQRAIVMDVQSQREKPK